MPADSIDGLAAELNKYIGHDPSKGWTPEISTDTFLADKENMPKLLGFFYVFIPKDNLQQHVKEEIERYANDNNINFIVTDKEFCSDNECHGHSFNPLEIEHGDFIFVNAFPKSINGTGIYFLSEENFAEYQKMIFEAAEAADR